jgi:hypothetical protein
MIKAILVIAGGAALAGAATAAAASTAAPAAASAEASESWRLVNSTDVGDDYLDVGGVTRRGGEARFRHRIRFREPQVDAGPPYNMLTASIRASCGNRKYRLVEMAASLDGANEERFRPGTGEQTAVEGSLMAEFILMACTGHYPENPACPGGAADLSEPAAIPRPRFSGR